MNSNVAITKAEPYALAARFSNYRKLSVRQRKRWLEVLLSFEMKNSYEVYDEHATPVLRVEEQGHGIGSFLARMLLGPARPFSATVSDLGKSEILLELRRPFRFIFHRLEIRDGAGRLVGAIQKRWSWVRRIYQIEDAQGQVIGELFGPLFKPWTFEIRQGGEMVGAIRKKWSGFAQEMFSDADNFAVELNDMGPTLKMLAFGATVLVDVVHFERAKG
jgi:uncharacterized protein YxjI